MSPGLSSATIAVLGYGHQGEAHALNLRDAGLAVLVGARPGREAHTRARAAGFEVLPIAEAARRASIASILLPDEALPGLWAEIAGSLGSGATLVFAHGFNLLYSDLAFAADSDVVLVSPTGPGRVLRALRLQGETMPGYLSVHRDASGSAWATAEAYAQQLGCAPLWRTTVREETEVDLFGEQAVLCGGMNALVTAAFEILVERGYAPELAYLECVHQVKYLADLLHERGVAGMRAGISGTAMFGDLTRGPRVIGEASRAALREILEEIRSGAFAREWSAEVAAGRRRLLDLVRRAAEHPIERARRRALGQGPGGGPEG